MLNLKIEPPLQDHMLERSEMKQNKSVPLVLLHSRNDMRSQTICAINFWTNR